MNYLVVDKFFNIYKTDEITIGMEDECDSGDMNVIRLSDQKEYHEGEWLELEVYDSIY